MKIGIIGAGMMGSAFAKSLTSSGHQINITDNDLEKALTVAEQNGPNCEAVDISDVCDGADLLIAATPADQQAPAIKATSSYDGMTIIDICNPMNEDMTGVTIGTTTSMAEEIQKELPGANIVKAFNTTLAQVITDGPDFGEGQSATVLYCGDNDSAKGQVRDLIESMGFEPLDSGPLQHARYLEPLGCLNFWLAYVAGHGTQIAPVWLSRPGARHLRAVA